MSAPRDGVAFLAFSEKGAALAEHLRCALGGTVTCTRTVQDFSLPIWTEETFAANRALVFVGAVGIAVRAVAPYLKSKASDPAVLAAGGPLLERKHAGGGITMDLAWKPLCLDWRWQDA